MKGRIYLLGLLLVILSLVLLTFGCAPKAPSPEEVVTFKYAGFYPPQTPQAKNFAQYFMAKATEHSNGRIQWEYFPSSQMGKATEQLDIVGGGAAEFGTIIPAFFTGKIPIIGVQDLPFLFNADVKKHIQAAIKMMHQPEYAGAFEQFNTKLIGGDCQGTMAMYFKKPLTKLEDWKGRKIRAAGKLQSSAVNALGAAAQSMVSAEVYLALSTGVLDGSLWHPLSARTNKLYEVADYAVIPYISLTGYTIGKIVNLDVWNGLPKDLQDAITKAAKDTEKNDAEVFPALEKEAIATLEQNGMHIYYVPQEENERWREATKSVWSEWLAANGEPGQRLVDFVLKELGEK